MSGSGDDNFEVSEFSIYEILYQGHAGLTWLVENEADMRDPFEILAAREERAGRPLIFIIKESDM